MTASIWKFAHWKRGNRPGRAWGMGNWKIGRKLGAGFGLVLIAMAVVTAIGSLVLYRTTGSIDGLVNQRIPHSVVINTIKNDFRDILFSANKIIAMGDPQSASGDVASIEQALQFVAEGMTKLDQASFLLPEEKQRIAELKKAYADFQPGKERFLAALKLADPQQAIEQARGVLVSDITPFGMAYLQSLDTLIRQHEELAAADGGSASKVARGALVLMVVLAGAGGTLGVAVAVLVTRSITRPLRQAVQVARQVAGGDLTVQIPPGGADETGMLMRSLQEMNASLAGIVRQVRRGTTSIESASFEIAEATSSLSARTEQQADALGQSAASLNQLAGNVGNTAANAGLANQQAQGAADTAMRGGAVVAQVVHTMELIKKSSQRIADIIGVVDSIAFQTNILALNAAVEAARAGDQGRGFAVVAAEVRSLAQRSAASSKEIKALINESVANVDNGAALVDSAGRTMGEIMTSVRAVAGLMGEITQASREQSSGIDAVNLSIRQMDEVTQQNAAMVEEAFGASEELKRQAIELGKAVRVFTVEPAAGITGDAAPLNGANARRSGEATAPRTAEQSGSRAPALLANADAVALRKPLGDAARPAAPRRAQADTAHASFHPVAASGD